MSDYNEYEDELEVRISKRSKPRSAMSTYKGTMGYREDMMSVLMLSYERFSSIGRSVITQNLITSVLRGKAPFISRDIKENHTEELQDLAVLDSLPDGSYVATEDLVSRGIDLCKSCEEWYGSTEDGFWAEAIPMVSSHFLRGEFTRDTKISWKLDNALHPRLGSPFHSRFFPDVTYGLRASARGGGNPNLTRQFLSTIPTLTEPSFSPFVNQGRQLCFPFLIWERKSDSGETLKAENQLGLPAVKALDILEGLGLSNIPIIGLTTVGATWQVWVGHICVPPRPEMKYILRLICSGNFGEPYGAIQFFCVLDILKQYVEDIFLPAVLDGLTPLRQRWDNLVY